MVSPFRKESLCGRLMIAEVDMRTRFKYTVWFDYTREMLTTIQDGDLIAVPNFSMEEDGLRFSVLKLVNMLPIHFALGSSPSDLKGYPGFISESAKNIVVSWREQETEPLEDTTKIVCSAVPTGLEFVDADDVDDVELDFESSMPMIGEECRLLSEEMTMHIINAGIDPTREDVVVPGHLVRSEGIEVFLRVEDLLKTHFGVFGFTGVGKSNLVSSMVSALLVSTTTPLKVVLFDLMDEYTGLLIDRILDERLTASIVCVGEQVLPEPTLGYIYRRHDDIRHAAETLLGGLLLPRGLKAQMRSFLPSIERLLTENKIRILDERGQSLRHFLGPIWEKVTKGFGETKKARFRAMYRAVFEPHLQEELTARLARTLLQSLGIDTLATERTVQQIRSDDNTRERLELILIPELQAIAHTEDMEELPEESRISIPDLIAGFNDEEASNLLVIVSHDPDRVRNFSSRLGTSIFEGRRRTGRITPLVSFVFDEADQFIPFDASGTQRDSKAIIEDLTRRGRKFGIGIGIATQRAVYLDTNIMGQLHTYFISKLPRETDRDRVGEAFSLAEEEFTQTFKFRKGDWLLVSHDAMGVDAVPIPIHAPNAEERIEAFLADTRGERQER